MGRPKKQPDIAAAPVQRQPARAARKTIIQRIFDVQAAVGGGIKKDKHNKEQNYDYTSDALIVETVREAMIDAGIVLLPPVPKTIEAVEKPGKNGPVPMTRVWVEFILASADDIEDRVTVSYPGDAIDYGDKGVYKAMTGARKYFYRMTFNLASEDDPEEDSGAYRGDTRQNRKPVQQAPARNSAPVQQQAPANPVLPVRQAIWKVLQGMGVPEAAAAGIIHEINPAPAGVADYNAILKTVQDWSREGQKWDPATSRLTTAAPARKATPGGSAESEVRALLARLGLSKMEVDAYCHRAGATSPEEWVSMNDYIQQFARDGYKWNPKTATFEKEEKKEGVAT